MWVWIFESKETDLMWWPILLIIMTYCFSVCLCYFYFAYKILWTITSEHLFKIFSRDPWVAQQFGACLWPRARSWRPGIKSHIGLPVHGACFSLCLCLCLSLSLSVWLSWINKFKKKKIKKKNKKNFFKNEKLIWKY